MPRELLCTAPRKLEFREYVESPLADNQVRVRSEFGAAKHGTEMSVYRGHVSERGPWDGEYGLHSKGESAKASSWNPGNMIVGTVTELGPNCSKVQVGQRILCYGGFRETRTVNETACWIVPPDVSWESAVCLDPADFALGALRDGNVRLGDAVAVFGMGAIGLVVVQLAKLTGAAPVIAVDPLPIRREAAQVCGADLVLDPERCDVGLEIKKVTGKRGVDIAIEYSGSPLALQAALRGIAYGGTVVAGAFPAPYQAGLDLGAEAHINRPTLIFSRACSDPNREHPRWDNARIYATCWRLICEGKIRGEDIVRPVVPFSTLLIEYPRIDTEPEANVKLGVTF